MKNAIPLVVAVVLGLLAVFAVSRTLAKNSTGRYGKEVSVLVATGNLKSGGNVGPDHIRAKLVPMAHLPKQHILDAQRSTVIGQKLLRDIPAGDYVLWSDVGQSSNLSESVGDGEWAVPVHFKNTDLVRLLKPGDEIAVVGMFSVQEKKQSTSADADAKAEYVNKSITSVLFPQVRVMGMAGTGTILLSLPPQQVLTIIAAQEQANLYVALRRSHDDKATNRKSSGKFDCSAFSQMLEGCVPVAIPDQPFNKAH